jgi:hypothetical protein
MVLREIGGVDVDCIHVAQDKDQLRTLANTLMKRTVFWDITLCSPLNINRQQSSACHLLSCRCLACPILRP